MIHRSGQSLVELLVGIGFGVLFIAGSVAVIVPALKANTNTQTIQANAQLGNQVLNNVNAWAAGNWAGVLALATGTANTYYLNVATSSFTVSTGSEPVFLANATYTIYFYLNDVYRDSGGNVTTTITANNYDPSTKQATIVVNSSTYTLYLTRHTSNAFSQTSWAGGSGQNNPITLTTSTYATSTNITISSTGTIQLATGNTNSCTL